MCSGHLWVEMKCFLKDIFLIWSFYNSLNIIGRENLFSRSVLLSIFGCKSTRRQATQSNFWIFPDAFPRATGSVDTNFLLFKSLQVTVYHIF